MASKKNEAPKGVTALDKTKSVANNEKKENAALGAIEQIRSRFGEGAIMKLGDVRKTNVDAISTGCL